MWHYLLLRMVKKLKTNFSEEALLLGVDIMVEMENGKTLAIKIPTLGYAYSSLTYDHFLRILNLDPEKLSEDITNNLFQAQTLQGLFVGMKFNNIDLDVMDEHLPKIIPGAVLTKRGIEFEDEPIPEKDLQYIKQVILVGAGVITMRDFNKRVTSLNETEIDRINRENQEKIDKIKGKANKSTDDIESGETISIEQAMGNIILLLPGTTLKDIRELNQFSFQWLSKYASGLISDRIIVSAAGMVGLKDYKFVTERVK